MVFMTGILACFYSLAVPFSIFITAVLVLLLNFKIFSVRRVCILIVIFYFGFFLTFFKIKNYDDLLANTPMNSTFTGRIVSVPNSPDKTKSKFFMQVTSVGKKTIQGKTLVTVSAPEDVLAKLNIGEEIRLKGSLREPFSATNPSQFDYSSYLKNKEKSLILVRQIIWRGGWISILIMERCLADKMREALLNGRRQMVDRHRWPDANMNDRRLNNILPC